MPRDEHAGPALRVPPPAGAVRDHAFVFSFDGQPVRAYPGETIGAALLASGIRHLRTTRAAGRPRGLFCGIGACFDCLVTVNGVATQRACLTPASPGDDVEIPEVPGGG